MVKERTFTIKTDLENQQIVVTTFGDLQRDLVLFHHGAGYTSQTWLQLIKSLQTVLPSLCFVTFDMRGHGQSSPSQDFSFESLVRDAAKVIQRVVNGSEKVVEVFLIGHSLGAAVLAALPGQLKELGNIKFSGLVMVDIIEETAIKSLSRMPTIIKEIPKSFESIELGLKWNLSSSHSHHNSHSASKQLDHIKTSLTSQLRFNDKTSTYEWITDLSLMEPFWNDWFLGLTQNFLKFPGSRLLILADVDYMDREMMVAQMQGKFQFAVVRESGHAIQEDQPNELAEIVNGMIQKHLKLSQLLHNK